MKGKRVVISDDKNITNKSGPSSSFRGGKNNNRGRGGIQKSNRFTVEIPEFESNTEEEKFKKLKAEISWLVMPGYIRKIQQTLNIANLSEKFLSDEWIDFQRQGWEYDSILKPDGDKDMPENTEEYEYNVKSLENKWGDIVLFRRKISS
jgi:hypothetical protein